MIDVINIITQQNYYCYYYYCYCHFTKNIIIAIIVVVIIIIIITMTNLMNTYYKYYYRCRKKRSTHSFLKDHNGNKALEPFSVVLLTTPHSFYLLNGF